MNFLKKLIVLILTLESRLILAKYRPFIVAVTGSVGKTSAKDAIYSVLRSQMLCRPDRPDGGICYVRKSDKSMNSEIGLPLTVIGVPNAWRDLGEWLRNITVGLDLILSRREYPDCLVLELGADHPGDIRRVARWLKPDIAVITKVSRTPVHVEFFSSPEEVFEEKASLADAVRPGGSVVLFADDDKVASISSRPDIVKKGLRIITFGIDKAASVRGLDASVIYDEGDQSPGTRAPAGMAFTLDIGGATAPVSVRGVLGTACLYPLLAAAAVGKAQNLPIGVIAERLNASEAPKGRMNLIPGVNGSTIIDDTYNSSPDAVSSALEALKGLSGPKIALLGDMMELGKYSPEEHRKIGREAASVASRLVTVGPRSHATAEEAAKAGLPADAVRMFDSATEAAAFIQPLVSPGDIILVKGSQSMRMERAVRALMRDPSRAAELLVRQEKEWLEKA